MSPSNLKVVKYGLTWDSDPRTIKGVVHDIARVKARAMRTGDGRQRQLRATGDRFQMPGQGQRAMSYDDLEQLAAEGDEVALERYIKEYQRRADLGLPGFRRR